MRKLLVHLLIYDSVRVMSKSKSPWPEWMKKGVRVVRGPDWTATIRDSQIADLGTLIFVPKNPAAGDELVSVVWDTGLERSYSSGYNGQYALRAYDIQQVGVIHNKIKCSNCGMAPLRGIRYFCTSCCKDLCTKCYMSDADDLTHIFERIDTPGSQKVTLPQRAGSKKMKLFGVFPKAEVIRGPHWNYPNKDGGDLNKGTVKALIEEKDGIANGWVRVEWEIGKEVDEYRFGANGYVDVVAVKAIHGGDVYMDHIPLVGNNVIRRGDKVIVNLTLDEFKAKQDKVPDGWKDGMKQCLEKTGTVLEILLNGDVCNVQYENGDSFVIVVSVLYRTAGFYENCPVKIIGNEARLRKLQEGHGGFGPGYSKICGKPGIVTSVLKDGDLQVNVNGKEYTLNPTCCSPVDRDQKAQDMDCTSESDETVEDDDEGALWQTEDEEEDEVDCVPGRGCLVDEARSQEANKELKDFSANMREVHTSLMKMDSQDVKSNMMFDAFNQSDLKTVKKMIEENRLLVNHKVESRTLLHLACYEGYTDFVKDLLDLDADTTEVDDEGDTPLHYAAFQKQALCAKILLERDANCNAQNNNGSTPLIIAVNHPDLDTVKLLLEHGADVNLQNSEKDTALHDALEQESDQPELTEMVLKAKGADFTIRNDKEFNVVQWACIKSNKTAVEIILEQSPHLVDVKFQDSYTCLHIAAANDFVEICSILLQGKANPNPKDDKERTPLHLAVAQGHKRVIELLVDNNADVNAKDIDGDTPLHLAQDLKKQDSLSMTKSQKSKKQTNIAMVYFLLEKGADITIENKAGKSPLDLIDDPKLKDAINRVTAACKKEPVITQAGIRMPIHWRISGTITEVDIVPLDVATPAQKLEFDDVKKHFVSSLPNADIVSVKRVQNALLWEHYSLKKREMEKKLGQGCANELHLYHGTNADLVDVIARDNFDFRIAGSNVGAIYGRGTYFASTAKYSDLYASPNKNGDKVMFVAKVLVGKFCQGRPEYTRPPQLDVNDKRKGLFDSVVNQISNPTIYCVFDLNQYYPEYIVEYR